ncbi:MAG: hypothetical protein FWC70_07205 [Defluviitaleaceae bacterium]|nr:hypothetical protein [Defluviitaleaceae bacterium]
MKPEKLFELIGEVDEKFVAEAAEYPKKSRRGVGLLMRLAAAACLVFVAGASVWIVGNLRSTTIESGAGIYCENLLLAEFLSQFSSFHSFGVLTPDGQFRDLSGRLLRQTPQVQWTGRQFLTESGDVIPPDALFVNHDDISVATSFALYNIGGTPLVQIEFTPVATLERTWDIRYDAGTLFPNLSDFEGHIWDTQHASEWHFDEANVNFTPVFHSLHNPEWQHFKHINGEFVRVEFNPPDGVPVEHFTRAWGFDENGEFIGGRRPLPYLREVYFGLASMQFLRSNEGSLYCSVGGIYWRVRFNDGIIEPLERLPWRHPDRLTSLRMNETEVVVSGLLRQLFEPESDEIANRLAEERPRLENDSRIEVSAETIADFLVSHPALLGFGIRQHQGMYICLLGTILPERPPVVGEWRGDELWTRYFIFEDSPPHANIHIQTTSDGRLAVAQQFFLYEIDGEIILQIELWSVTGEGDNESVFFRYVNTAWLRSEEIFDGRNLASLRLFETEEAVNNILRSRSHLIRESHETLLSQMKAERDAMQERHENAIAGAIVIRNGRLYLDPVEILWFTDEQLEYNARRLSGMFPADAQRNWWDVWFFREIENAETSEFGIGTGTALVYINRLAGIWGDMDAGQHMNDFFEYAPSMTVFDETFIGTSPQGRGIFFVQPNGTRVSRLTFEARYMQ